MCCRVRSLALLLVVLMSSPVLAAELGRRPADAKTGRAEGSRIPVEKGYQGVMSETGPGVEIDLDWNSLDYDVGDESYNDQLWTPQLSISYGVSDLVDIRFAAKIFSASDKDSDLNLLRLGIGTRAWFSTASDFVPYLGFLINYYVIDGSRGDRDFEDAKGTFGVSAEAGVAYLLSEWFALRAGLQGEISLADGEADVGDEAEDISVKALSFGVGGIIRF